MADQKKFQLSILEAQILVAINHVGWYAYLWFPVVQREVMNFGSGAPDQEVHAAFASLIDKGALVIAQEKCFDTPEWRLAPGVLAEAEETLSLETDLRTRYGYSDPTCAMVLVENTRYHALTPFRSFHTLPSD